MIKFNTYCKKVEKLTDELCQLVDTLTEHRETVMHFETAKDARIRLQTLSSLKNTSRRIECFLNEVNRHEHEKETTH